MNEISYKGFDKAELEYPIQSPRVGSGISRAGQAKQRNRPKGTLDVKVLAQRILWQLAP